MTLVDYDDVTINNRASRYSAAQSTVGVTDYDKLPLAARLYLERIEQTTGVPIHIVSTSPDRDHTIMRKHPFQL